MLTLGSGFSIERQYWRLLCQRIDELLKGTRTFMPFDCPVHVEEEAQHIVERLLEKQCCQDDDGEEEQFQFGSLEIEIARPRSVGVEHVGMWAAEQFAFPQLLEEIGFNRGQAASLLGSIIGRMAAPASERQTWRWLCHDSGLGELLGVDFMSMSAMRLYRASDILMKHRSKIEDCLFNRTPEPFDPGSTVILYDCTNTYFEGSAKHQEKARFGRSKERRSDCPLLTLGLILDGGGFLRRCEIFPGNAVEGETLGPMLEGLPAGKRPLVVMDAGIATQENIDDLQDKGYRYVVVSRERKREFDPEKAVSIATKSDVSVHAHKVEQEGEDEIRLYCRSSGWAAKEKAIIERRSSKFESELTKLHENFSKPRTRKKPSWVWQKIGRLDEQGKGIARFYKIELKINSKTGKSQALEWKRKPIDPDADTLAGVYCLRTNVKDMDEQQIWTTYTMLTDLESVFRSMKSELGLRPIYHSTQDRSDAHLLLTVIAWQFVQLIRQRLRLIGDTSSWKHIRQDLETHDRVSIVSRQPDRRCVHVRKAMRANPRQLEIYRALGMSSAPGRVRTTIVGS